MSTPVDTSNVLPVTGLDRRIGGPSGGLEPRGAVLDGRPRAAAAKRAADVVIAVSMLVALAPLLVAVAVAVKLSSPGSVMYRQRRVGRDGRHFDMLKFRSMRDHAVVGSFLPPPGSAPGGVEGVDRRTPVGRFLRDTSIDELPQLVNVIRGDMSLVGPRPERPEFVELFADEVPGYTERHRMRVGMTGLAQSRGLRGQTSIARRTQADNEYIDGWSLALDARIVLATLRLVVGRSTPERILVAERPATVEALVAAAPARG